MTETSPPEPSPSPCHCGQVPDLIPPRSGKKTWWVICRNPVCSQPFTTGMSAEDAVNNWETQRKEWE